MRRDNVSLVLHLKKLFGHHGVLDKRTTSIFCMRSAVWSIVIVLVTLDLSET